MSGQAIKVLQHENINLRRHNKLLQDQSFKDFEKLQEVKKTLRDLLNNDQSAEKCRLADEVARLKAEQASGFATIMELHTEIIGAEERITTLEQELQHRRENILPAVFEWNIDEDMEEKKEVERNVRRTLKF